MVMITIVVIVLIMTSVIGIVIIIGCEKDKQYVNNNNKLTTGTDL